MVRNSSKALVSPKVSKTKKKIQEDVDNQENKVSQIITSSAWKQKPGKMVIIIFLSYTYYHLQSTN